MILRKKAVVCRLEQKVGARGRDGDQLQHTLWEEGVHPGGHLPTGMEMKLKAGIAGASLGQGLTGLVPWPGAGGSPSRSVQVTSLTYYFSDILLPFCP